jgi:uncharacterized membrane protein YdbT with pleckstrin-like domain
MEINQLIKQKSYERIEYILRRHPITFIPEIALFIILGLIPLALWAILPSIAPVVLTNSTLLPIIILTSSVYYLGILAIFFTQFIDFYLDLWIITNDRIIDVEQFGIFARNISELDLFRIQDVTTDVHGLFSTFFKYGNVTVKTASDNQSIIFKNIRGPHHIQRDLIRLSHEDRKFHYPNPTDIANDE